MCPIIGTHFQITLLKLYLPLLPSWCLLKNNKKLLHYLLAFHLNYDTHIQTYILEITYNICGFSLSLSMVSCGMQYTGLTGLILLLPSSERPATPKSVWNGSVMSPGRSLNPPVSGSWQAIMNCSSLSLSTQRILFKIFRDDITHLEKLLKLSTSHYITSMMRNK